MGPHAGIAVAMGTLQAEPVAEEEEKMIAGDQRPQPQPASSSRDGAAAASKGGTAATPAEVGSFKTENSEKATADDVPAADGSEAEEQPRAPPSAFVRGPVTQSWEMFGLLMEFANADHQASWENAFGSFFPFASADEPIEDVEERLAQGLALLEEGETEAGLMKPAA